jgi:hypothetical protein
MFFLAQSSKSDIINVSPPLMPSEWRYFTVAGGIGASSRKSFTALRAKNVPVRLDRVVRLAGDLAQRVEDLVEVLIPLRVGTEEDAVPVPDAPVLPVVEAQLEEPLPILLLEEFHGLAIESDRDQRRVLLAVDVPPFLHKSLGVTDDELEVIRGGDLGGRQNTWGQQDERTNSSRPEPGRRFDAFSFHRDFDPGRARHFVSREKALGSCDIAFRYHGTRRKVDEETLSYIFQ